MSYATRQALIHRLTPAVYDRLTGLGQTDDGYAANADAALEWASGVIDSYLGERFSVPVSEAYTAARAMLAEVELALAEWLLWSRHGQSVPEGVAAKQDQMMRWLRDVADGKARPPGGLPDATAGTGSWSGIVVGADRAFSRDDLEGF